MDFEKELERVVQQYRDEGYNVFASPDKDLLGSFPADAGVDILATRGTETVLVQVKQTRAEVEADPSVPLHAAAVNARPGWRYDLVVLGESDPVRRLTRGSREPSNGEIDETFAEVERLVESNHVRAAFIMAWGALEASMRRVASDVDLYPPKTTPLELMRTLYGNGRLTREEFTGLDASYRVRSQVVHGLVPPTIDPGMIHGLIVATRRLLTGNSNAQIVSS